MVWCVRRGGVGDSLALGTWWQGTHKQCAGTAWQQQTHVCLWWQHLHHQPRTYGEYNGEVRCFLGGETIQKHDNPLLENWIFAMMILPVCKYPILKRHFYVSIYLLSHNSALACPSQYYCLWKSIVLPLECSISAKGAILVLLDENSTIKMPFPVQNLQKANSECVFFA